MQQAITRLLKNQLGLTYLQAEKSTDILINAFDQEHRIVFWNRKAENYFGINKEFALGKKIDEIIPDAVKHDRFKYLIAALCGETVQIDKGKYQRRSGYYKQQLLPVEKGGKVIAALNIMEDIE